MNYKKITILIVILTIFININVFAKDDNNSKYEIESANYNVELQENGEAIITEDWIINYTSSNVKCFYRDFYSNISDLEKYIDLTIESVEINNQEAKKKLIVIILERVIPIIMKKNKYDRLNLYYAASENEQVEYKFKYKINKAVKFSDNKLALFCYSFTPKNFKDNIEKSNVTITIPSYGMINTKEISNESGSSKLANRMDYTATNVTGKYRIYITINPYTIFSNLTYISQKLADNSKNNKTKRTYQSIIMSFGIYISITILIAIINKIKRKIKIRKNLKDPNYVKNIIDNFEINNCNPMEFFATCCIKLNPLTYIPMTILNLHRENSCTIGSKTITISFSIIGADQKIIEVLLKYVKYETNNGKYLIDVKSLKDNIENNQELLNDLYKTKVELIHKLDNKYKEEKSLFEKDFKNYIEYYQINNYSLFKKVIEENEKCSYKEILSLGFDEYIKVNELDNITKNEALKLAEFLDYLIYK